MKICHHPAAGRDAAGMVNAWLWPRLIPDLCARADDALLLGTGGLIDAANPEPAAHRRVVVFGAGARGTASVPDMSTAEWDIRFVRGPETARALGLGPDRWLCDPAVLAPKLHDGRNRDRLLRARTRRIGFLPGRHFAPDDARTLADGAGLHLIAAPDADSLLDALAGCDAALCGDPVAAVLADAFGIPWRPLRSAAADDGDAFEWLDLSRSMGLTPCAVRVPRLGTAAPQCGDGLVADAAMRVAIRDLRNAARCDRWSLSDRTLLRLRQQALGEELADLQLRENTPRRSLRLVASGR
jgi:hypothetical protein